VAATRFALFLRRRGVLVLALSVAAAWVGAKSGGLVTFNGFWDGPI